MFVNDTATTRFSWSNSSTGGSEGLECAVLAKFFYSEAGCVLLYCRSKLNFNRFEQGNLHVQPKTIDF